MKRWLKRHKRHDKKGMSALAWMLASIGVLFMLYVPTELTLRMILGQEVNGILDNAVSAAITQIEEDHVASGELTINPVRAERTVYEVIGYAYGLDVVESNNGGRISFGFDESDLADSKLKSVPDVEFQLVPFTKHEVEQGRVKQSQPFNDGSIYPDIESDTVVIRATMEYPILFMDFMGGMELSRISAAQAQITPPAPLMEVE